MSTSARRRRSAEQQARAFPAFPPQRRGARFARTWWGEAWITAMEDASLDRKRLSRGRTYARAGYVGPIVVSPGRLAALVYGSRDTPYQTQVTVEQLTAAQWDQFLDRVAATAGHIAALLDRDMPHDLVSSAEDLGIPLLPGIGDLQPECTCPDWGDPCKHAAALCYQASWLLDADPFVLLLMRGRGERELLDEMQRRNVRQAEVSVPAARTGGGPAGGTPAAEAFAARPAPLPDLDDPLPPEDHAAEPLLTVPEAPGVDPAGLALLARDAAGRARQLLADSLTGQGGDLPAELTRWQDTVRLAATHPGDWPRTRQPGDPSGPHLARAVAAWTFGGAAGLQTLEQAWTPDRRSPFRRELALARAALADTGDGTGGAAVAGGPDDTDQPGERVWRNRWTVPALGLQLRFGRDGRWYAYRADNGEWAPVGPPRSSATEALADALSAAD
ncbi:SWIM zinc finger family protein [Goodfellowiella coeruleoviolacea]|uniref:Conserved protein, contains Zn finger domain n=1 Tax=Goodfellowiella coeruleoviolacea TaxID=334858 RepID=A0AAE3GFK1_9PSEU|nr:SWIM zinc finger family protein [Goodfellowiella coeruleoviolacea]MCP2165238.1 putative conserved protein, contains Zn finger domain [Goodfellowiella coeruleoviolacea]